MKKVLTAVLLSVIATSVYANASHMIYVTGAIPKTFFTVSNNPQQGYQFTNETGKQYTVTVTVNSFPIVKSGVQIDCFHGGSAQEYPVYPGQTATCTTNDTVKIVTLSDNSLPTSGIYKVTFPNK